MVRIPLRSHSGCCSSLGVCRVHGLVRDGAAWVTTTSTRTNLGCPHSNHPSSDDFITRIHAHHSQFCLPSAIRCPPASCRRAATDDRSAVCCCLLYRSHGLHSNPVPVSSRRCLSYFHTWMTDLVAGFPLRCCQRFSVPDVATEPCGSSHNSSTSGLSSPVLSY